ncbi:hypothetical protein Tco_0921229 [Tanacetum coccineum]
MTTLAEHIIVARAKNRPPMLEKSMYDSWASRICLFIKGNKNGRMMLDSIDNGPLVYPTIEENRQTRPKKYSELTEAQQLQDDCDVQVKNIILHGLSPDVYALVNHQEATKDIWDRVKLLIKGTKLSYQEHECRLYNLFDKFASFQGETLYEYYWRFSQLIKYMHTIRMIMHQVQVNTKFLNDLPPEWSKFVTDVKLAKSLYTSNYYNTPKLGHSGIRVQGVLLHRSITQDIYRTTKKSFKTDTLDLTKYLLHKPEASLVQNTKISSP